VKETMKRIIQIKGQNQNRFYVDDYAGDQESGEIDATEEQ